MTITQAEIEVAILQICNQLGMNAVLPSENMVIDAWRAIFHEDKDSVASKIYKQREIQSQVIEGVREFYKAKRRREGL
jgi:hypothetical protein